MGDKNGIPANFKEFLLFSLTSWSIFEETYNQAENDYKKCLNCNFSLGHHEKNKILLTFYAADGVF